MKILIGMPCYTGDISHETTLSLMGLLQYHTAKHPDHEIKATIRVRNFVTYAAEKITETAVAGGYDYLFYCGDDVVFPSDSLERLMNHNKDIVCLSIFARSEPYGYYAFDDKKRMWGLNKLNSGLQKAYAAGTGVMLFKVEVFKKMRRPWWRWPNDETTDCDTDFFERLNKETDAEVWVDTDIVAGHLDFTHRVINQHTHKSWLDKIKSSGVLDNPDFRKHKDFHKLEAILNGSQ